MSELQWVVDASALLAAIQNEPGGERIKDNIDCSVISAINWSEVLQKLTQANANTKAIASSLQALGLRIIDFTHEDASLTAELWDKGKKHGLSLADRACLATGQRLKCKIITADKAWSKLQIGIVIEIIR